MGVCGHCPRKCRKYDNQICEFLVHCGRCQELMTECIWGREYTIIRHQFCVNPMGGRGAKWGFEHPLASRATYSICHRIPVWPYPCFFKQPLILPLVNPWNATWFFLDKCCMSYLLTVTTNSGEMFTFMTHWDNNCTTSIS